MKTISLISVWNNEKLINEMKSSAQTQKNVEMEFIFVDNTQNKFTSASKALNYGVSQSNGEVLVFLHQDIEFLSDDVLEYIFDFAKENQKAIFGAAGVGNRNQDTKRGILSAMYGGPDKIPYKTISEPTKAFTLDECLIACHKNCMNNIKFDEEICNGWHLYGADLCLQAQAFEGMPVYAVPLNVWHKSNGNADKSYYDCQNRLAEKYKKYYAIINTTNGFSYTNSFKRFILNVYRKVRYGI